MTDQEPPEETSKLDAAIERVLQRSLGRLLDSGKIGVAEGSRSKKAAEPEVDVKAQVAAALKEAKEEDKRTASEKARDSKIAELEAKLAGREQAPRQHRPIVKAMGWIHKDDGDEGVA